MPQAKKILTEMDSILDGLIENARKILKASQQVIAEEDLTRLQKEQKTLVDKLTDKDSQFNKCDDKGTKQGIGTLRKQIDDKIDLFQKLNAEFVDNIAAAHGLIQFEKGHIKKRSKQ